MLQHGDKSKFKDFFINWNEFWEGNGKKMKMELYAKTRISQ
jgi:hypothetical protein